VVGAGVPGAVGLNVTCFPLPTAVHWPADGHATPDRPKPIVVGVGVPGAVGLNVTSSPPTKVGPTAVHWLVEGHVTPDREWPLSIVVGVGVPGAVGLNVTCCVRAKPCRVAHGTLGLPTERKCC
jgi:hypothetical protein